MVTIAERRASYRRRLAELTIPRMDSPTLVWMFLGGLGSVLILAVLWQFVAPALLRPTQRVVPAAISAVALEALPEAIGVHLVVAAQNGVDVAIDGTLAVELRSPDGSQLRVTRRVAVADFGPLPTSTLLGGRLGYRLVVPNSDWARPPRRGGPATVIVTASPRGAEPIISTTPTFFP